MSQARRGPRRPRTGRVDDFDQAQGLGTVVADDGTPYVFHCTALADETRTVDVGARVLFAVAPGHLGRMEARGITVLG